MQDDEKKPEDNIPAPQDGTESDFSASDDIDDIDLDDDDFEDVAWDDFDDLDEDIDEDIAGAPSSPSPKPAKTLKQKSFFSQHFNAIVIGAAVIGAIGWFLISMSKPPVQQAQNPAPQQETTEQDQQADPPPTATEDSGYNPSPTAGFMQDPDSLVKGIEQVETQQNLDNIPPMPTPVQTQIEPEDNRLTPMPQELAEAEESIFPEENNAVLSEESVEETDTSTPEREEAEENPAEEQANAAIFFEETNVKIQALGEKIEEMETFMTTASADVNAQISVLDDKIVQLTALMEEVTNQREKLEKIQKAAEANKKAVTETPVPVSTPPAATPEKTGTKAIAAPLAEKKPPVPPEAKEKARAAAKQPAKTTYTAPATPKTTSRQSPVNWQLRGAGTNMAMIAPQGSNQIKTIRVGDSVTGLGRINFIGQENGRWVVRGTQGEITQ